MAQKIVTMCDAHLHTEESEVPAHQWEVSLREPGAARSTTWSIDLCREDGKTLEDVAVMLGTWGRVIDGPRRLRKPVVARESKPEPGTAHTAPESFPCPVDGCDKVSATETGRGSHLRDIHGTTYAEAAGLPVPFPCPQCDRAFTRAQSLGVHMARKHPGGPAVASSGG